MSSATRFAELDSVAIGCGHLAAEALTLIFNM
jgi:hypothetical protein